MTISAISSVSNYSYSASTVYSYFGSTVSESRLQELMDLYGITQTGDSDTDIQALYEAMYSQASSEAQSSSNTNSTASQTSSQSTSTVPWADVMSQIGLNATQNAQADYATFNDKISQLKMAYSATQSQEGLAMINQISSQAEIVFAQAISASNQNVSNENIEQPQVSGADITAQLNKLFL